MKAKRALLKLLIVLVTAFVTTAAFGQMTYTWTGGVGGAGTEIGAAINWGGTLPNTATSDTGRWDGSVPGPLSLVYNTNTLASGFGQSGVNFHLTSSQTGSVTISKTSGAGGGSIAIYNVTIDSGAGAFTFGGPDIANRISWVARPTGAVHQLINNSTNTASLTPWIQFLAGGGAVYTLAFSGTGNWQCDSYLNNDAGVSALIQFDGPGSVFWNPTGFSGNNSFSSPIAINGGKLVLRNTHPRLGNQAVTLTGSFEFNLTNAAAAQTLSGVISGMGTNTVIAGTLILSGQSTYTGPTILNGGKLIVAGVEIPGVSGPLGRGPISFTGGTLGFGVNNVFDYSSRFSTTAGQAYRIDTGGQNVTFTNGLGSSSGTLTKSGAGTLALTGTSSYSGLTTVSAGTLVFQGPKIGPGDIIVADGAALGSGDIGTQIMPGMLALGTSGGATLEFNNVNSTTIAPLAPATVSAAGPVTININSGSLTPGNSYPLLAWTSGSAPTASLGVLNGFTGNLSISGNTLLLNVTAINSPTLNFTKIGNSLQFSWSGSFKVQAQTNSLDLGISTNWDDYPGGGVSPVTVPVEATKETVFFRLVSKP